MKTSVYVIRQGDTLSSIAQKFGTDVKTIAGFNGITDPDNIEAGKILRIPVCSDCDDDTVIFGNYTIEKGDTLYSIAKMYGTDVNTLARLNGIPDPDNIEAGRVIRVPLDSVPDSIRIYIVRDGDTLYDIGKKYGYSIEELAAFNDIIDPDKISIGQVIRFPTAVGGELNNGIYTVRSGDSLWKIAQRFNVTVADLINDNKLSDPDNIFPGQKLIIDA